MCCLQTIKKIYTKQFQNEKFETGLNKNDENWMKYHSSIINAKKCSSIAVGKQYSGTSLKLDNQKIARQDQFKCLGIMIDKNELLENTCLMSKKFFELCRILLRARYFFLNNVCCFPKTHIENR